MPNPRCAIKVKAAITNRGKAASARKRISFGIAGKTQLGVSPVVVAVLACGALVSCVVTSSPAYAKGNDPCWFGENACEVRTPPELRDQLANLYYDGSGLPAPMVPTDEMTRSRLGEHERACLNELYTTDQLRTWAFRDTDNDDIPDYRIACNGKFFENDTDVDGDGILNVLDHQPYTHSAPAPDSDGDAVPDHIDWSSADRMLGERQSRFMRCYGLVLTKHDNTFLAQFADIIEDLLATALRTQLKVTGKDGPVCPGPNAMRALRVLSVQPKSNRESSILAEVIGQTGTLIFYVDDDEPPSLLNAFGTLAHEVAHNYQFNLDQQCKFPWDRNCADMDFALMKQQGVYLAPQLYAIAHEHDWQIGTDLGRGPLFTRLALLDRDLHPDFQFHDESGTDVIGKIRAWGVEVGETEDYDTYWQRLRQYGVVSEYSLTDPYEWQAEQFLAYLMLGMESHSDAYGLGDELLLRRNRGCMMQEMAKAWGDGFFNPWNAKGTPIQAWHAETFAIDTASWKVLTDRYWDKFLETCGAANE